MAIKTFTTGEVLTASDTNTYLNNGGLVYITEATATSGTILGVNSCFSSTYDNYELIISNFVGIADVGLQFKLRNGSTPSSSDYYYSGMFNAYGATTTQYENGNPAAAYQVGGVGGVGQPGGAHMKIFRPNFASYTGITSQGFDPRIGGGAIRIYSGYHRVNTAYNGFELISSNTITSLTVRVYGYRQA